MQIGKTIRKYRKEKGLTQEEMANRLGVTTPAVNKWENENSYPDIALLAPIARLLGISLDTLLSFQEDLTGEEITAIVLETDQRLKTSTYDEVFLWEKSINDGRESSSNNQRNRITEYGQKSLFTPSASLPYYTNK